MDVLGWAESSLWLAVPVAVVLGVLLGLSPLGWSTAVTALGVAAGSDARGSVDRRTVVRVGAGTTAVYVALGAAVGVLESFLRDGLGAWAGPLYVVLAVAVVGVGGALVLRPTAVCRARLGRRRAGGAADVSLGVLLAAVGCPACAGLVTGVALAGVAAGGVPVAILAMAALGVGQTLSILGLGRVVSSFAALAAAPRTVQRVAGVTLVLAGLAFGWQAWASGLAVGSTLP